MDIKIDPDWEKAKHDLRQTRENVAGQQAELERMIQFGLIVDPDSNFIPLSQLDLKNAKGVVRSDNLLEVFGSTGSNDQQEKIVDGLNEIVEEYADVGIYDNKGNKMSMISLLTSANQVQNAISENFPGEGSFIMLSTIPDKADITSTPIVFRVTGPDIMEYVPWKTTARFLSSDDYEVLSDVTAAKINGRVNAGSEIENTALDQNMIKVK